MILLLLLVAYPFCMALYFSLSNAFIGRPSHFIGFTQLHQPLGQRRLPADLPERLRLHAASRSAFKIVLGISLALLLNQQLWFKRMIRGAVLLPWVIPTALSTLGWWWMFNSLYSVVNWTGIALRHHGPARAQLARPEVLRDGRGHHRQHLARSAVLRHHHPGRAGRDPQGALRGGRGRRRRGRSRASGTSPCRCSRGCWPSWCCSRPSSPSATSTSSTCSPTAGPSTRPTSSRPSRARSGWRRGRIGEGAAISLYLFPVLVFVVWAQLRFVRKQAN